MKKIWIFALLLVIGQLWAKDNQEFRALWVITWEHINPDWSASKNKAHVREILDNMKAAHMNAVLWQVRQSGTAYYNSSFEPWGYYAGHDGMTHTNPGYDPLAYAIQEAHKRGMELHAWFNTFHVSSTYPGTPAAEHPEWICTNRDDQYMTSHRCDSPGLPEVRDYTLQVAMEIVRNYDIDGLHLDFIRWNEYDEDDMKAVLTEQQELQELDGMEPRERILRLEKTAGTKRYIFDKKHRYADGVPQGYNTWADWRRDGVTKFVHALHDSIQAVKPWVRLSPAALGKYKTGGENGWNGYYVVFQDAALWFNQGYIDQLTPMHYHWTTGSSMKEAITSDWEPNIQPGIQAGRLYTVGPGSYILDDYGVWDNHEDIVQTMRTLSWVDGFQFFSYASWAKHNYWQEAAEKFFKRKTKIRDTRLIVDETPPAPALMLTKIDSMHYQVDIQPPDTLNKDQWFAIYRSIDSTLDEDNDQIVDLHYGRDPYSFTDSYWGEEPVQGRYTYFGSMLDRYWNESDISNSAMADSVPHYVSPPEAPQHIMVLNVDSTTLKVTCDSAARAEEYIVYISLTGSSFTDSVVSATHNIILPNLQPHTVYYFKIRTRNISGSSKLCKHLYGGVTSADPFRLLVVNGFDRGTNSRYDYIGFYARPISQRGYGFSYVMNESVIDGRISLNDFRNVIWILGDESTADQTFSSTEQSKVKTFLKQGGNLFVSGSEIGWDLDHKGSSTDRSFYNNYLKARYVADAPGGKKGTYYSCQAIAGKLFDGLPDFSFDNGSHGTFNVEYPDAIEAVNGAKNILKYKNVSSQNIAGIEFEGVFPGGNKAGKLINLGLPYETIYPESRRIDLMSKTFDFFEGKISNITDHKPLPLSFELKQNYPNPFGEGAAVGHSLAGNSSTIIRYVLGANSRVQLTVYNMLGQKIVTLVDKNQGSGIHTVTFDGNHLASGVYIYRLRVGNFVAAKKMMLIH